VIVVTGGAGFIGSNLIEALNQSGVSDILVVDTFSRSKEANVACLSVRDCIDKHEFRKRVSTNQLRHLAIDVIYHFGACTSTTECDATYLMDNNYLYSKELLHFSIENRSRFIYASSAAVYGGSSRFREQPEYEKPLNLYGISKLMIDNYVRQLFPAVDIGVVGLRLFNVYGPREAHKGVMSSMVHQCIMQAKTSGIVRIFGKSHGYGDGEQRRDFVYVADAVRASLYFGRRPVAVRGIYNVGTGRSRTFNDIARCVIRAVGRGRLEYIDFPASLSGKYQSSTEADVSLLASVGCKPPSISLEEGVQSTVEMS
jgi:ADP-L-glycero-D-manno-heptose 6-epimerase